MLNSQPKIMFNYVQDVAKLSSLFMPFFCCVLVAVLVVFKGYLGLAPVAVRHFHEKRGWNRVQSEIGGAVFAGVLSSALSHPIDTIKTCMQGNPNGSTYSTLTATAKTLYQQGGVQAFFRGAPWRVGRTVCSVFIIGKCRDLLASFGLLDA
eukprot:m.143019 g.143019  ORF g.143019 m.143019 type:complete len:151 (+) comp16006_c10_seq1:712-1164(+)